MKQYKLDKADYKNRQFSRASDNLSQAQSDSKFWGSARGTINRLPGAMRDTVKKYTGFKKGGKVKKTGPAIVHKGERVLNKKQASKFENAKKKHFGIKKYGAS